MNIAATTDAGYRARVLAWLRRMETVVPDSPYLREWDRIPAGQAPVMVDELARVSSLGCSG
jgi:hypothetical protein